MDDDEEINFDVDTFLKEPVKSPIKDHNTGGKQKGFDDLHGLMDDDPLGEKSPDGDWFGSKGK